MTDDYGEILINLIKEGAKGDNIGLAPGIEGLPTILRKQIITILGGTGSGKTYGAFNIYGIHPMTEWIKRFSEDKYKVFHWIMFSFEMEKDELILRLASYIYALKTQKLIPSHVIAGFEKGLKDEDKAWIIENCAPVLSELSPYFTIYASKTNQEVERIIHNFYKKYGKFDDEGNYITDKQITLMCTVDHLGLLNGIGSTKQLIDELMRFEVKTTTVYKTTWLNVQQFNRDEGGVQSTRKTEDLRPSLKEAKDSGNSIDASHVVAALFNPNRFNAIDYLGYPIASSASRNGLEDRVRVWFILKRRFGSVGYVVTAFYGEAGVFQRIPLPENLTTTQINAILEGRWFPKRLKKT